MADEIIGRISVGDGATFTPSVSSAGELSWTNNKNLPNPATVDIAQAVVDAGSLDSRYLQLSGGTMTSLIRFNYNTAVSQTANNSYLYFYGGTATSNDGARLTLTGKNHSWAGGWRLEANDGTNTKVLLGSANGALTWNGINVITAAGGTMTGAIQRDGNLAVTSADTSYLNIYGGTGYDHGAWLQLTGKSHTEAGGWRIQASDGINRVNLLGKSDGTLTWGGVRIAFDYLGSASTGVATNFTLPSTGWWLVVCGHNSTPGLNGIFAVRTGGNMAFKLAGAGNITMTCSGATITVTPSGGAVQVAGLQIPIA